MVKKGNKKFKSSKKASNARRSATASAESQSDEELFEVEVEAEGTMAQIENSVRSNDQVHARRTDVHDDSKNQPQPHEKESNQIAVHQEKTVDDSNPTASTASTHNQSGDSSKKDSWKDVLLKNRRPDNLLPLSYEVPLMQEGVVLAILDQSDIDQEAAYWENSLVELVCERRPTSFIGRPIGLDSITANKERISYSRVLVEVDSHRALPDEVLARRPDGSLFKQPVIYEWKPSFCTSFHKVMDSINNLS